MPYRRLPNTDEARVRALRCAVEEEKSYEIHKGAIAPKTLEDARVFLPMFENAQQFYKQAYQEQVNASKMLQELMKQARMYISHFIQVFNLAIIRNEVKAEHKTLYGMEPDSSSVPDMINDTSVLEWGERIIKGERERISQGGSPIYNPAIAKVTVHFEMFKDAYFKQKIYQRNTNRALEKLGLLRDQADSIILEIWNQVEDKFKEASDPASLEICRRYGLVYYYRKGEQMNVFD